MLVKKFQLSILVASTSLCLATCLPGASDSQFSAQEVQSFLSLINSDSVLFNITKGKLENEDPNYAKIRGEEFKNFILNQLESINKNEIGREILSDLSSLIKDTGVKIEFSETNQNEPASFCYTRESSGNVLDDFTAQGVPTKLPDTIFINIGCRFLDNPSDRILAYRGQETFLCSTPNIGKKKLLPGHNVNVYEVENTLVPFHVVLVHELIHMKHYLMSLKKNPRVSKTPTSAANSTESQPATEATALDALEYGLTRKIDNFEKAKNRYPDSIPQEYQDINILNSINSILLDVFFDFTKTNETPLKEVDPNDEAALNAIKNCLAKDPWFLSKKDANLEFEANAVISRLKDVIQEEFKQDSNEEQEHNKDPKRQELTLKKNKQQQNLRRGCLTFVKNNDFSSLARQKNWRDLEEKRTVEEENAFRLAEGLSLRAFDENMTDGKIFMYESEVNALIDRISAKYKRTYQLDRQGAVANYVAGKKLAAPNNLSFMPVPLRLLCQERVGQNAIVTRILRAWYDVPTALFEQAVQTPAPSANTTSPEPNEPSDDGGSTSTEASAGDLDGSVINPQDNSSDIDIRISQTIGEIKDKEGLLEILQDFLKNSSIDDTPED